MTLTADEVEADDDRAQTILRGCLRSFAAVRLRVTGDCMSPELRPGDLVTLTSAEACRPRLGDVVLFRGAGGLRLHRLVPGPPRRRSLLRLKADRAAHWDAPVDRADFIGTAVGVERDARTWRPRSLPAALRSALHGLLARLQRP